jgi:hypothetical protein
MLLDMHLALRCRANSKRSGLKCRSPAVLGGRVCRMSRGGAPEGNKNALKYGAHAAPRHAKARPGSCANGPSREPWATANPVRSIFKETCALACLPYFNPHSIRNTLVQLAYERKLDAERFKAWSQNLGHESCLTTFSSYGEIPPARQAEIIRGLAGSMTPRTRSTPSSCGDSPTN